MAQSTSLSQTHDNTGTSKTDENNGGDSVFTDNEMEGDMIAAEFAEDPIEKQKRYRGVAPHRIIPDRQRDRDYREMEYNNFMLSPWVGPQSEDETAGSSSSRGRVNSNTQGKEPELTNKNATAKLRQSSPKERQQISKNNPTNQKPHGH